MNYFQTYLSEEFAEDYQEGRISRRQALKLISSVTGSLLIADGILSACAPLASTPVPVTGPSQTPIADGTIAPNDPSIHAGPITFQGEGALLMGYRAIPRLEGSFPVVLVCHENRGLTPYIQDVTRRLAKSGYAALAVDLLSRHGGTPSLSADEIPGLLGNIAPDQFVKDFLSGWHSLQGQSFAKTERVGMLGFCFGGGVTWLVATQMPELRAAVPFYGPPPPVESVPNIHAAVLAFYGGKDQRITSTAPAIETAMRQNNKTFEKVIYPDADHAFHNDTGPRYNHAAAQDAWQRTLDWFKKYLV
jgi:carboxymethylenebutenolidase